MMLCHSLEYKKPFNITVYSRGCYIIQFPRPRDITNQNPPKGGIISPTEVYDPKINNSLLVIPK